MSFDVFLFKFAKGDAGELPRDALRGVLEKHDFRQRSDGFYNIRLHDGSEVELQAGGLMGSERFTVATFFIRGGSAIAIPQNFPILLQSSSAADAPLLSDVERRLLSWADTSFR